MSGEDRGSTPENKPCKRCGFWAPDKEHDCYGSGKSGATPATCDRRRHCALCRNLRREHPECGHEYEDTCSYGATPATKADTSCPNCGAADGPFHCSRPATKADPTDAHQAWSCSLCQATFSGPDRAALLAAHKAERGHATKADTSGLHATPASIPSHSGETRNCQACEDARVREVAARHPSIPSTDDLEERLRYEKKRLVDYRCPDDICEAAADVMDDASSALRTLREERDDAMRAGERTARS